METAGYLRERSDVMSSVLTILAALEAVFPNLSSKATIRLHIMGAENYEYEMLAVIKEILHVLPALKELNLHFIGPQLSVILIDEIGVGKSSSIDCCQQCKSAKGSITMSLWSGLYHDILKTSSFAQPDLALAFQPGWTNAMWSSIWLPTIKHLASAKHATLLTSFTAADAAKEMTMMYDRCPKFRFIQRAKVNKWKAMTATLAPIMMKDALPTKENRFYHKNHFWYISTRKS